MPPCHTIATNRARIFIHSLCNWMSLWIMFYPVHTHYAPLHVEVLDNQHLVLPVCLTLLHAGSPSWPVWSPCVRGTCWTCRTRLDRTTATCAPGTLGSLSLRLHLHSPSTQAVFITQDSITNIPTVPPCTPCRKLFPGSPTLHITSHSSHSLPKPTASSQIYALCILCLF